MNGTGVKLQIWDTAGQDAFKSITRSYYRSAAAALVMFDLSRKRTFESVAEWLNDARSNGNPHMVYALVGNKSDLVSK